MRRQEVKLVVVAPCLLSSGAPYVVLAGQGLSSGHLHNCAAALISTIAGIHSESLGSMPLD